MCCIFAALLVIGPRFALFLTWVFTPQVTQAYSSFWVPFFGLLLLPWTTLMYALAFAPVIGVTGLWGWAFVAFGVLMDISSYTSSAYSRGRDAGTTTTYA